MDNTMKINELYAQHVAGGWHDICCVCVCVCVCVLFVLTAIYFPH
jgi:hypothetical protein